MGIEDKTLQIEGTDDKSVLDEGYVTPESELNLESKSTSHHHYESHHRSHSHHSSGSHHGGHSSHHRRHSSAKKHSLFKRIKIWFKKKLAKKSALAINVTLIAVAIILLLSLFFGELVVRENSTRKDDGSDTQTWTSTSSYTSAYSSAIPSYWETMVSEKTETVKALQTAGGKDCVSFVWASDTHIPDNDKGRTDNLGKVMARMLDNCAIPFAVLSGDIGTRESCETEEEFVETQKIIPQHLAPLWGTDRLLVALGNHDGCWGGYPANDYKFLFTPERLWQLYFREQALDSRRVFSEDGSYYYVDNTAQKTRFIILNSHFSGEYAEDENGWAVNNSFEISCYGQEQLDWLASEALDMPDGYSAVITVHVPPKNVNGDSKPYTVDYAQIQGIINAYNNKSTFSGSYTEGVDGWTNSTVNVDFTNAKGEIIAMFAGHVHQDTVDTTTMSCPIITIISSGASVNAGKAPERPFGTDNETSFDVVTINKKTRTIYCTRVGAGEDREIRY